MENVLRHLWPTLDDRHLLAAMRISIFVFTALVLTYSILSVGTPIYDMVSNAYQITLVGSFVPLTFGLYWRKATTQGAIGSIVLGIGVWALLTFVPALSSFFPGQLGGLLASIAGMLVGSLMPQFIQDRQTDESKMYHVHPAHLGQDAPAST